MGIRKISASVASYIGRAAAVVYAVPLAVIDTRKADCEAMRTYFRKEFSDNPELRSKLLRGVDERERLFCSAR